MNSENLRFISLLLKILYFMITQSFHRQVFPKSPGCNPFYSMLGIRYIPHLWTIVECELSESYKGFLIFTGRIRRETNDQMPS